MSRSPAALTALASRTGLRRVLVAYCLFDFVEFFVVGEGEFDVDIDGEARPQLGKGDGFGEIALLHSVPRTATVAAATAGRLLVVRSEDFLAAVTGSEDGHALAREIAASRVERDHR